MEIIDIFTTIKEDWAILVFFFTMGAIWWQSKTWFQKTTKILESIGGQHLKQDSSLDSLHVKMNNVHQRLEKVENAVNDLHEEIHDQDVKIAILENRTFHGGSR